MIEGLDISSFQLSGYFFDHPFLLCFCVRLDISVRMMYDSDVMADEV